MLTARVLPGYCQGTASPSLRQLAGMYPGGTAAPSLRLALPPSWQVPAPTLVCFLLRCSLPHLDSPATSSELVIYRTFSALHPHRSQLPRALSRHVFLEAPISRSLAAYTRTASSISSFSYHSTRFAHCCPPSLPAPHHTTYAPISAPPSVGFNYRDPTTSPEQQLGKCYRLPSHS